MRYFFTTLTLLLLLSCNQRNTDRTNQQPELPNVEPSQSENAQDSIKYIYQGDTTYYSELVEKIRIGHIVEFDSTVFVTYAKYSIKNPIEEDMSFYFDSHFINAINRKITLDQTGQLIEYDSIGFSGTPLELGDGCGHEYILKFSQFQLINTIDSSTYFLVKKPECSDATNHILVRYSNGQFSKLFELETTENRVNFKLEGDSLLTCVYSQFFEDWSESYDFAYDLNNDKIVRDTVYNRH